jgi:aprataxin
MPVQKYEALLKTNLECFKCQETFKTIPQLKIHLQKEWDEAHDEVESRKRRKTKDKTPEITSP